MNNRFYNGIYASALDAKNVFVYAYGDWMWEPYDDQEAYWSYSLGADPYQRSYENFELIVPSWKSEVYSSLALESLREGIEDSRVIATLKKEIGL
ncbi:MAG: hypothetical protein V1777_01125, partial [Candidatus Micrarchaeota archaeon]